ncbi:hypothetical protein vseg_016832 [Gypsophila vaccaria]
MAAITTKTTTLLRRISLQAFRNATVLDARRVPTPPQSFTSAFSVSRSISSVSAAAQGGVGGRKSSARLSHVQLLLLESDAAYGTPPPKIRLEHVNVTLAKSGGPGGQHATKADTKAGMRFDVKNATWLSERIRNKILLLAKNKLNKDGEIVLSSSKTLTQQGNIKDCLSKLQAIVNAAAYIPPPPSEEQKKKIAQLAAKSEQKRLQNKKVLSQKKLFL